MGRTLPDSLNPAIEADAWRPPIDERDVAVRLETAGVTDRVAQEDYDVAGTYELAAAEYPRLARHAQPDNAGRRAAAAWREHLRGMVFALPLLVCGAAMLAFNFSLWGGELSGDMAAAVAVGTVASFVATGGFVQAMARQGLFHIGTGEWRMAEISCRRWCVYGTVALLATAVAGLIVNSQTGWFPAPLNWTAAAFYVALGVFWFAGGILYMLERSLAITIAAAVGILVVWTLHVTLRLPLLAAQIIGISVASLVAFGLARLVFASKREADPARIYPQLWGRTLYLSGPYLLYGSLYYLLLFMDRLIAWTAGANASALPVIFRGDYELALDVALLAFVVQVGWVQSSTVAFYELLKSEQAGMPLDGVRRFNRRLGRFYVMRLAWFLPPAYLVSLAILAAAWRFHLLDAPESARVALCALLGYPLLVAGLWNVSLLFALAQPWSVVPAVVGSVLADAGLGYLFSRLGGYDSAAMGFTAGTLLFAALTTIAVTRRMRALDYYYFASAT